MSSENAGRFKPDESGVAPATGQSRSRSSRSTECRAAPGPQYGGRRGLTSPSGFGRSRRRAKRPVSRWGSLRRRCPTRLGTLARWPRADRSPRTCEVSLGAPSVGNQTLPCRSQTLQDHLRFGPVRVSGSDQVHRDIGVDKDWSGQRLNVVTLFNFPEHLSNVGSGERIFRCAPDRPQLSFRCGLRPVCARLTKRTPNPFAHGQTFTLSQPPDIRHLLIGKQDL
jgi:hypothetical protein